MRLQTPFIGPSNPQHILSKHLHVIFANGDNYLQFMKEVFSNKTFKSNNQSVNQLWNSTFDWEYFKLEIQAFIYLFL